MVRDLLRLALMALTDPDARPVFADAAIESGWFDVRVMKLRWPPAKLPPRGLNPQQRARRRLDIERAANLLHTREAFDADAARASEAWCRACAAVLLFGDWRKGRFPIVSVMHAKRRTEEAERFERAMARLQQRRVAASFITEGAA